MPHWGGIIPDSQLQALVAYIDAEDRLHHLARVSTFRAQVASDRGCPANLRALCSRLHEWRGAGLSVQGVRERPQDYAVVSRTGDGPTSSGRLELGDDDLVLHGSSEPDGLRIPLDELAWSRWTRNG